MPATARPFISFCHPLLTQRNSDPRQRPSYSRQYQSISGPTPTGDGAPIRRRVGSYNGENGRHMESDEPPHRSTARLVTKRSVNKTRTARMNAVQVSRKPNPIQLKRENRHACLSCRCTTRLSRRSQEHHEYCTRPDGCRRSEYMSRCHAEVRQGMRSPCPG